MLAYKLNKGDAIGVVSPSGAVQSGNGQFEQGVRFFEMLGFRVVLGKHVYSNTLGFSATPLEKADDINGMFADSSVKAIICSQGGANSNGCLPYLDWQVIAENPKVFLGISDITVLLNAIYARTGLVTFHGNDLMWGFGRNPTAYDTQEFICRLVEGQIGQVHSNGERQTIRGGIAEGKLLGGSVRSLLKLAGTPYWPDFRGAILFLEAVNLTPDTGDTMLHQLKQIGVFDQVQGVLLGHFDGLDNDPKATVRIQDLVLNVAGEYRFPILKVKDFGHNCPNTVLPVGGTVEMDADKQEIEILSECVRAASGNSASGA